jgi:hypothetical protein
VNGKNQNNKSAQPQSIVSEIKEKKRESEPIKDSKKRKKVEESDSSSSSSSSSSESEEEEAPKKKKKLTVWSDKDLSEDLHDNILLAIPAVVAKVRNAFFLSAHLLQNASQLTHCFLEFRVNVERCTKESYQKNQFTHQEQG